MSSPDKSNLNNKGLLPNPSGGFLVDFVGRFLYNETRVSLLIEGNDTDDGAI